MATTETQMEAEPAFRRPTSEDALAFARAQFLAGERVEMQTLAAQLGVSRTTVYRWVGEREQLMGDILSGLIEDWLAGVAPEASGEGIDLFCDVLRRFLEFAAASPPLTDFTQREPALALRVLNDREGAVTTQANETIRHLLDEILPGTPIPNEVSNAIGLVARTLVWANIATGSEPDIEGAVDLARRLLRSCLPE